MKSYAKRMKQILSVTSHMYTYKGAETFTLFISEDSLTIVLRGWKNKELVAEQIVYRLRITSNDTASSIQSRARVAFKLYNGVM